MIQEPPESLQYTGDIAGVDFKYKLSISIRTMPVSVPPKYDNRFRFHMQTQCECFLKHILEVPTYSGITKGPHNIDE